MEVRWVVLRLGTGRLVVLGLKIFKELGKLGYYWFPVPSIKFRVEVRNLRVY